ncbi:MAG: ATP-binding protein [Treponema sp.]|nr:ATP-binding protein [Treponema sp.]
MLQNENNMDDRKKTVQKPFTSIFIVIITAAIMISVCSLAVGAIFLTGNIRKAMEDDMLVAVDIADQYVTKELEVLKITAAEAAREIAMQMASSLSGGDNPNFVLQAGQGDQILERVLARYPKYIGLAVFDRFNMLSSWGSAVVPMDLTFEPFMQIAHRGGQAVSTTMHSSNGLLVMYVSAPINNRLVLAAVLPGLYFSEIISHFTFWESGHLFIDDENGHVISNYRTEWVTDRINFIELARSDNSYEGMGAMVRRVVEGERGTDSFSLDGQPRLCAFRPISSPTENWFIGIIAPTRESALKNIPGSIALMGMISLLLSIAAALAAAAILKKPYEEANRLRDDAESMSSSKSKFLANMSHEIRTPMNSILGFAELALDGDLSIKARDYLSKIKTNAQWLLQIINDILDISKVESGKMELENIPFDMHDLFSSCRTLIMPKVIEKGLTLYFYAEPSVGKRPLGDPTRLRQVLVNLLSNAAKFTNTGMVKLHAALINMTDTAITMHFEVKDSGIGMSKEQLDKIFNPFAQAESGTTRKFGGTGLGLAITKNIIEMMGGKLYVESTPGVGSKFSFDLVFDAINITDDDAFDKKIVLNEIEKPAFNGEVLLCEDNPMNQQVICEHLSRVGLKTVVADNGKVGLELIQGRIERGEKQFDLIFMDMHMPVMDGLEASSKILKLNTGIPMIALTANIMSNDREIYRENGMYDCVGKPFTSQELWRCLMKYLTPISTPGGEKTTLLEADLEFQKSLQIYFVKSNQNKVAEIVRALDDGDIELAHRMAHTLKGNAGQLGKTILQKAAADLERQIKSGKNNVTDDKIRVLDAELNVVLNELTILLDESGAAPENKQVPVTVLSGGNVNKVFEELEELLKSGNPGCLKYKDDLLAIQGSELLVQQMEDFEFELALITLKKLKEGIG